MNEVNEFAKSEALSQIERDLINNRHRYEEENKETELRWDEQMFRTVSNTLVHTSLLQKVGGPAEFVGRLQNYLYQRRVKGRTENEAIADVVDRHFNYF